VVHTSEQACYWVDPADLDKDAQHIVTLWSFNLGHAERRQAKFDWFYRHNPAGLPQVLLLKHAQSEAPIGTVGLGARILRCGPHSVRAGLMADFAVNTQHRTLFPALTLQRALLEQGLTQHELLYGFPNSKSLPVVKRAGFEIAGGLNRYVRVLRTQSYLTPRLPASLRGGLSLLLDITLRLRHGLLPRLLQHERLKSTWLEQPDARFDDLWAKQEIDNKLIIGVRDRAFLAWRFAALPWHRYRLFTVSQTASDKLLGYAVCEAEGETLHVRDLLVAKPVSRQLPTLLRMLMRDARKQDFRCVSLEFMGPEQWVKAMRRVGMREREHLEQTLITAMSEPMRAVMRGRDWYLTRADVDA
jgi:hypothetical protein